MSTRDSSHPPPDATALSTGQWAVAKAKLALDATAEHGATLDRLIAAVGVAPNRDVPGTPPASGLYGGLALLSGKVDALTATVTTLAAGFADDRAASAERRAFALWVGRVVGGGAIIGLLGVVGTWFAHHWH